MSKKVRLAPAVTAESERSAPSSFVAFVILSSVALISAATNGIWDCDESMNYWEPMHFVQFGYGLQTWEYSPEYGLRSYFYVWIHVALGKIAEFGSTNKVQIFYFVRAMLGLISSAASTYLYSAVLFKYGNRVAKFLLFFLALSTGMFISSTSFLPSTFAMYCLTFALAAWLKQRFAIAEVSVAAAAILGWPFSALVGVPIAIDVLIKKGPVFAIKHGLLSLIYFLVPSFALDTFYYGKPTIAVWNIVDYNVISKNLHGGSELYGVEPWFFYIVNGFLNFNVALGLALIAAPVLILCYLFGSNQKMNNVMSLAHVAGFYLWFCYMSSIPHKEERFIFPVYPQLCLAAALALAALSDIVAPPNQAGRVRRSLASLFVGVVLFVFILLSFSRTSAMLLNYSAPLQVYSKFENLNAALASPQQQQQAQHEIVCVGKEWYRFATHYFLPERYRLGFIKSDFGGQLPQYFASGPNASRIIQPNFNDHNKEEPSRYIHVDKCNYVVDLEAEDSLERVWPEAHWKRVVNLPFLEASKSHKLFRAFFVPFVSNQRNVFSRYVLLKRVAKSN